jgi:hypothetical protein
MPAWVHQHDGRTWMYYSGWNRRLTVPYHNATGLAVSDDGGRSFTRAYEGPVLDRTPEEPHLAVTPWILRDETPSGAQWQAWYISGLRWARVNDKFEPVYVIKHARSADGVHWQRANVQCVAQAHPLEAFSHPTVLRSGGRYHLWYCCRHSEDYRDGSGAYRIGYAWSDDGERFERCDDRAGIVPSPGGWDSTMNCYPAVVSVDDRTYMFYNGNGFGRSGIGVAVLEGELDASGSGSPLSDSQKRPLEG